MRQTTALLCALALLLGLAGCGAKGSDTEFYAMDTVMTLTAYGKGAKAALEASEKKVDALESLLSRTREDSEISRLNAAAAGEPVAVDSEVARLLEDARAYTLATGGAFDITVAPIVSAWGFTTDAYRVPAQSELDALLKTVGPDKLSVRDGSVSHEAGTCVDLGGIAKGYASDCVADIFAQNGIASGKVALGGNVYVCGSKPDGSLWRIAVQDPANPEGYVGVLQLSDAFAVTSGSYQRYFEQDGKRYHHIIDPATGYPAESGLTSVTVVARRGESGGASGWDGALCDALSTALFVMGPERALDFWRMGQYAFELVLVTEDGRVLVTGGLDGNFERNGDSGYVYESVS